MGFDKAILLLAGTAALVSARRCQNITVPVNISARNGNFNQSAPSNNIEVTNFILDLTQQGHNYSQAVLNGYQTVSGTYTLATTFCEPDHGSGTTIQLLTHGIGFDRSYWDLSYNNYNYSYVEEAVDQYGYSTFTWDRLGVGESQHGEPVNEIQAWLEVAALHALTSGLRQGTIPNVRCKFDKVVHGGHSFGSEHSYALTAMYPDDSDGIFLTGFGQNGTFIPYFALGGNFIEANKIAAFSQYPNGYLATTDATGVQTNFFAPGQFDPNVLQLAVATGQPVTIGELLTIGGETGTPNTFGGPVLVITGRRDIPYCGGDCLATGDPELASIPAASKANFINAKPFEAFIVPNAGHGLNLEYSHPVTYATILNFLVNNDLAASEASSTCLSNPHSQGGSSYGGHGWGRHSSQT
ncbi:hypothetical protein K431DRAFT_220490 [Polychaeton citri CBS 116435]|uniref:AB hydrolase-1 domain-containing protein n=1 Tax=Polychaeton citri CBS 116435 TaxID=1314669 RepID=A0A9P4Q9N5_9PEZI|nr:hypothetical protein K431DRAFT_220490 [Polychaeton citri CBS 116435]